MPIYFLLSWWTIPSLASRFDWFLYLQVTQTCKGEKEGGTRNIGNFRNKNKHNISPMIIPLPPVSLTFSTASESLNWSSSTFPHHLHFQHRNAVAPPPPPHWNHCNNQNGGAMCLSCREISIRRTTVRPSLLYGEIFPHRAGTGLGPIGDEYVL